MTLLQTLQAERDKQEREIHEYLPVDLEDREEFLQRMLWYSDQVRNTILDHLEAELPEKIEQSPHASDYSEGARNSHNSYRQLVLEIINRLRK